MGKKKNASAAGTSISKDIQDLKTINSDLAKEVAEFRKQIEHLCSLLDSLIADRDIPYSTDRDIPTDCGVLGHVLSSTHSEAERDNNAQIAEATYNSATAELKDMEMPLLPFREQEAVERDLELVIEGSDITKYSEKAKPEKIKKKSRIFYPIAITVVVFISTAVVSLCKSSKLKK